MDDLYHQEILQHFKHPHNYGELSDPDLVLTETNQSCGDSATFYLKFSNDGQKLANISFTGTGCAISIASCSMLTDYVKGKDLKTLHKLTDPAFVSNLTELPLNPSRQKCIMLAAKALASIPAQNSNSAPDPTLTDR